MAELDRLPGQSGSEELERLLYDKVLRVCLTGTILVGWMMFEWVCHLLSARLHPGWITLFAVGYWVYAFFALRKLLRRIRNERRGVEGEREVAQLLADLRADGYITLNDILCEGFNLDHALVGPGGVLCIETKNPTKAGKEKEVVYDGAKVRVGRHAPTDEPIVQVTAGADSLVKIIRAQTGISVRVQPVLVYPDWWVRSEAKEPEVWVLNPKQIFSKVRALPKTLEKDDIVRIVEGLRRHQKFQEKLRAVGEKG